MGELLLNIRTILDNNKTIQIPFIPHTTTAEDVCIVLCKQLGVGNIARHIFALREYGKSVYLMASHRFEVKNPIYDLRVRYKAANVFKLKAIDIKAYDYYFHQARTDVVDNKIADLSFDKYRSELVGLGVADMYRVMLEKDIPRENVESDYKKYMPKEVLKRHLFFVKKPIHDALGKIKKSVHDAWYVKEQYLRQLEAIAPDYPIEEYKALWDQGGSVFHIIVRIYPPNSSEPGIKYSIDSKRDKWNTICLVEELGFISIRQDSTVETSRRNGIPFYLKFNTLPMMYSFVSLLDGYYRLTAKWTFNICKDVTTPSLQRLYAMKCHGPVGGEFSYAKLEEKRSNRSGCFILRESETKSNIYFIDLCLRDGMKPKTFKLERLSSDEFIFNDDLTRYQNLAHLMSAYKNPQDNIYLGECLPPSEYDQSPLLLCQPSHFSGDSLTDGIEDFNIPPNPVCINTRDLQVYKDVKCLKWDKKRKKVLVGENTFIAVEKYENYRFAENSRSEAKNFCRNPDGDLAGPWCFIESKHNSDIFKQYCSIPFCDQPECVLFTRNETFYTHYVAFPSKLTNFTFGLKLWDPDSYINASARIVFSLLPLPISSNELNELGIGVEFFISNRYTFMNAGNKDKPELNIAHELIKSTEYTYFDVSWDHGFITLYRKGDKKPLLLQEYKTKGTLLGYKKDQFHYYAMSGTNLLWTFPLCDVEEMGEKVCDEHTTGRSIYSTFFALTQGDLGHDLEVHIRGQHSAYLLLVVSPIMHYPNVKILLKQSDNYTRVTCTQYEGGPTITLHETVFPTLLSHWRWHKFSINLFADTLRFYWMRDVGAMQLMEVRHEVIEGLRWYSPASENTLVRWTFNCKPTRKPPEAWLPECALNGNEASYVGTQDVTAYGQPCVPWSAKKFIPKHIHEAYKANELLTMYNYCRDPSNEKHGTYCYALNEYNDGKEGRAEKTYCMLRKCKSMECRIAGTGNDYIGRVAKTRSNRTCQYWIADVPLDIVRNYYDARKKANPNEDVEADMQLPTINASAVQSAGGGEGAASSTQHRRRGSERAVAGEIELWSNFSGSDTNIANITTTINEFMNASSDPEHHLKFVQVHTVPITQLNGTLYADMSPERAENFCRNPSRSLAGAWCYTMDKDVPIDACDVPDCDLSEECTVYIKGNKTGQRREGSEGMTIVYRGMWRHTKGKKMEIAMKILKPEFKERHLKDLLELAGQWAFLQSNVIVRLFGVTLTSHLSMVMEYVKLGTLDQYLQQKRKEIKAVDLLEAASNLASALWHLAENRIVHGNIRCRKLLVSCHNDNSFTVKLADPGIHTTYTSREVHWIPIECYANLNFARHSNAADVWAFATTLWEIFMFGEEIKHLENADLRAFYINGKRLHQPQTCPNEIYKLMLDCWDADPHRRKLPQAIMRDINQMMYQVYNSRKRHAYATIKNLETQSIDSMVTESTTITTQDELIAANEMVVNGSDNVSLESSQWSMNSFVKNWTSQDFVNNEYGFSCDFSNIFPNFNFPATNSSIDSINSIQTIFELDNNWDVVLKGRIGQGFYGEVYKATLEHNSDKEAEPRLVAVKRLKRTAVASCIQDFEREISIMKTLKHPNIVEILGVLQEPEVSLVMEFVSHGSLQSYLKIYKETLTVRQLLKYALDIAMGMDYLGKKNIVHRDLAARNILVVDENNVKISDFGLAQVVGTNNYYILKTDRELPIKWYAIECLRDGKFSSKSDVWSYGVTMCEVFALGEEPHLGIDSLEMPEQQTLLQALEDGIRFPCPSKCPQSVFVTIILPCWHSNPHERPVFTKLVTDIQELQTQY